jgi:hypothetical protein
MDPDRYPVALCDADGNPIAPGLGPVKDKDGRPIVLGLGPLTAGVKEAFVKWVKPRLLADAYEWMTTGEYKAFRQEIAAGGVFWTESPCAAVAEAIGRKEGSVYLNRLLFGDGVKGWSDDQLWALLRAKDKDAAGDYRVAFDLVWDGADPKAQAPTGATQTSSSGTPTSTPPPTSAAPTGTTGSSAN